MDNPLQKLWAGLAKIQSDLDALWRFMKGSPTFGWAVVTAVDPLRIRYDGETAPVAGSPSGDTAGLQVGDRVWCQRINRRDIVLVASKDTGWFPISPTAGTAQHDLAYRRIGNEVIFRGSISGTSPGLVSVFTMPAGFRPSTYQYYPSKINVNGHATIRVGTSGLIEVWKGTGHTEGSCVSMSGIRYFTD